MKYYIYMVYSAAEFGYYKKENGYVKCVEDIADATPIPTKTIANAVLQALKDEEGISYGEIIEAQ